jgi:hypothetical protein
VLGGKAGTQQGIDPAGAFKVQLRQATRIVGLPSDCATAVGQDELRMVIKLVGDPGNAIGKGHDFVKIGELKFSGDCHFFPIALQDPAWKI